MSGPPDLLVVPEPATPSGPVGESWSVVIPTVGRPALRGLIDSLDRSLSSSGSETDAMPGVPVQVVVVDDRRGAADALDVPALVAGIPVEVVSSGGRGPAAARNAGWRRVNTDWVAFLDDDVLLPRSWARRLVADLSGLPPGIGGCQGRVTVPRPEDRRPTDRERNVIGLEKACWATADLAYRRAALRAVGGFEERFPRAHREDSDLGLRVSEAGWAIVRGRREVEHPVRPPRRWASLRAQVGNRDDELMRILHGPDWRGRCAAGPSRDGRHLVTVAGGVLAAAAWIAGRRRLALGAAAVHAAGTAELAWARISSGPANPSEVAEMTVTSCLIPWLAVGHRAAARTRRRRLLRQPGPGRQRSSGAAATPPAAVLFDRDGTLIDDVPYNGDPTLVRPRPGASAALGRLRAAGVRIGVVSNQSGIGRGLLRADQVHAVNRRVEVLLGPIDTWQVCPHAPADGCTCRKPAPGLVRRAASDLGVAPVDCALIGDIGADVEAASAAGCRAVLVPTPVTDRREVAEAPEVAPDLEAAVDLVLNSSRASPRTAPPPEPERMSPPAPVESGGVGIAGMGTARVGSAPA